MIPPRFPSADDAWVPTLLEVEVNKANEPDGSPIDWRRFGWSALYIDTALYPHVAERFDILQERFNQRYAFRMLNQETMERWQIRLQNRFDECVARYDRAYELYEQYEDNLKNDILKGRKTVSEQTVDVDGSGDSQLSGTDTSVAKSKYSDTPNSLIDENDDYAGSLTKNTSSQTYGRKDARTNKQNTKANGIVTETETGGVLIDALNDAISSWMDIDTRFVAEFENNFMNVYWY